MDHFSVHPYGRRNKRLFPGTSFTTHALSVSKGMPVAVSKTLRKVGQNQLCVIPPTPAMLDVFGPVRTPPGQETTTYFWPLISLLPGV